MPTLRLDKIIADTGLFSRAEAASLVRQGRVFVEGMVACSGSEKYDPELVNIFVDGEKIEYRKFHYIMLNKPRGYVSSTADKREKTVMELLDDKYSKLGLFPAGRLDKDAEGLLLLTNDGEFAHGVTSPSKKVAKRYFVETDSEITATDIEAVSGGITLGDGTKCLSAVLEPVPGGAFITLFEGKYHQVKRMMAALGKPVNYLKRVSIGSLNLDSSLKPGEYLELTGKITTLFDKK